MSDPVVVIGGGLGGLSAALSLARRGSRVTLLEKGPRLGGYAVSFTRGGYCFDLALHVIGGGGENQEFRYLARELDLDGRVKFIRLKEGFRVILGTRVFQLPNRYEEVFGYLEKEFPSEREGLRRYRRDLEKHVSVYARLFDRGVKKWRSVPPFLPRLPTFLRQGLMPASRYLGQFISDRYLKVLLFQPSVFMGLPMDEFPVVNFLMMSHILFRQGMYTIEGGGQSLTDALEGRLRELGVEIRTRTGAARILVERNRAVAVLDGQGNRHPASRVIAAVNLPVLVKELLDPSLIPRKYLASLETLAPSLSVQVLNLGLTCHPRDAGVGNHITVAFPDEDTDGCMRNQRKSRYFHGFSVTAQANSEPGPAERSRWVLSVVGGTDPRQWLDLPEKEYRAAKRDVVKDVLKKLESRYPGLATKISASDLATPRTFRRYTGNPSGAILGFSCPCGTHRRLMEVSRLPVKGIYPAGAWTSHLGGFMQSIKSGLAAADKAAHRLEQ